MKAVSRQGFTLVELLVVVSIMVLLGAASYTLLSQSTAQSRDAERQSDLRLMQIAIELYRQENGRYPEGCNGANAWSGELGTDYECSNGTSEYVEGLAPKYIRSLPTDPSDPSGDRGYVYKTDADGDVFKLTAYKTVEQMYVAENNYASSLNRELRDFRFCDADPGSGDTSQLCTSVHTSVYSGGGLPPWCRFDNDARISYAVWGGYSRLGNTTQQEIRTERVVCDSP